MADRHNATYGENVNKWCRATKRLTVAGDRRRTARSCRCAAKGFCGTERAAMGVPIRPVVNRRPARASRPNHPIGRLCVRRPRHSLNAMSDCHRLVHYLVGIPEGVSTTARSVEVPHVYTCEDEARSALGAIMVLSAMVHGDVVADSTSWYLQTAAITDVPPADDGGVHFGYMVESNSFRPIAGGFCDDAAASTWEPFIVELERERASRARLPWRRDMLLQLDVRNYDTAGAVDFSFFRLRPLCVELLVRPLDVYVTEPLF